MHSKRLQRSHNPAALMDTRDCALLIKLPQLHVYFQLSGGHSHFFFHTSLTTTISITTSLINLHPVGLRSGDWEQDGAPHSRWSSVREAGATKINSAFWHWGWPMPLCHRGLWALLSVTQVSLHPHPRYVNPHHSKSVSPYSGLDQWKIKKGGGAKFHTFPTNI